MDQEVEAPAKLRSLLGHKLNIAQNMKKKKEKKVMTCTAAGGLAWQAIHGTQSQIDHYSDDFGTIT